MRATEYSPNRTRSFGRFVWVARTAWLARRASPTVFPAASDSASMFRRGALNFSLPDRDLTEEVLCPQILLVGSFPVAVPALVTLVIVGAISPGLLWGDVVGFVRLARRFSVCLFRGFRLARAIKSLLCCKAAALIWRHGRAFAVG